MNAKTLATVGQQIYTQRLKAKLEPKFTGQVVAIEVKSGDYFVGETLHEARQKARAKYPDSVFHFMRIGHPAVYQFSSIPTVFSVKT